MSTQLHDFQVAYGISLDRFLAALDGLSMLKDLVAATSRIDLAVPVSVGALGSSTVSQPGALTQVAG